MRHLLIAAIFFALMPVSAGAAESADQSANGTLCTPQQLALEKRMLRVLASPEVQHQRALSRQVYESDPMGKTADGRTTMDAALDSISAAMVQTAIIGDPSRPEIMWVVNAAHSWFGLDVPNSGYGIENPDNVYRHMAMDGVSSYEIHGRLPDQPPAQQSFTLYATLPGMGDLGKEGSPIIGALDAVEAGPNGEFTVTIGPEPANGRPNHIQSQPQTALLIVRDSLNDWSTQTPVPLEVRRIAGPPAAPALTEQQMAERAAAYIEQAVPFWVDYDNEYIYSRPVNHVSSPRVRGGGWGFSGSGHFKLADNQALVVTLDPLGAQYLGFQLADPWGVGLEYVSKSGSLNSNQARHNSDGTITYVIAARDPGVHNWLDTNGLHQGIFAIRWQDLPASVTSADGAVRAAKVVTLSELPKVLPEGMARITLAEREKQLAERKASYMRRLCR